MKIGIFWSHGQNTIGILQKIPKLEFAPFFLGNNFNSKSRHVRESKKYSPTKFQRGALAPLLAPQLQKINVYIYIYLYFVIVFSTCLPPASRPSYFGPFSHPPPASLTPNWSTSRLPYELPPVTWTPDIWTIGKCWIVGIHSFPYKDNFL